jgi:hypothetical protein
MLLRRRFPHSGLSRHLVFLTSSSAVGRSVLLRVGKEVVIAEESKFFSELVVVPFGFNTLVRGEGCLTGAGWLLSSPGGCRQYVRRMTRPPFAVLDIGSTVGDDGGGSVGRGHEDRMCGTGTPPQAVVHLAMGCPASRFYPSRGWLGMCRQ